MKESLVKSLCKLLLCCLISPLILQNSYGQEVGLLKYEGGGDWYANPTAVPNLIAFCNENISTTIKSKPIVVAASDKDILNYPILFMTGHGNVFFSDKDVKNIRNYLLSGGFLHISDNYGLDTYIRRELKKLFPNLVLKEIPKNHPIYHQTYAFNDGIPKIHEHDLKPAQGFGLFKDDRMMIFYDYQTDLSDGWEDQAVHGNSHATRQKALQMGCNMVAYVFTH
ncbi:MAG: hypothetical protein COB98_06270 [Flavobacteriaceae bacterium]|nr:MAG: hypothetical protein COB98_06270 [Flavobacteriaceae bacterium]